MARYEGMDEILERLQARQQEGAPAPERSQPDMSIPPIPAADDRYGEALERVMLLLREAHELRRLLGSDGLRMLAPGEVEDLARQLEKVQTQLSVCEVALKGVPLHD